MRQLAPAGGSTHIRHYSLELSIRHRVLVTGLGLVVSPKLYLPLAYHGVQAAKGQVERLIGDSRVVAFSLPPRVTTVLLVQLPPKRVVTLT